MKINFKGNFNSVFEKSPFHIIDVGAGGGIKDIWRSLGKYLRVIGFEPDRSEYTALKEKVNTHEPEVRYINTALYSYETQLTLHLSKQGGSIRGPNNDFLKNFDRTNIDGYQVEDVMTTSAKTLDQVLEDVDRESVDFMKVDVEGCAAEVLEGAERTFEESLMVGVNVEVEFNPKFLGKNCLQVWITSYGVFIMNYSC